MERHRQLAGVIKLSKWTLGLSLVVFASLLSPDAGAQGQAPPAPAPQAAPSPNATLVSNEVSPDMHVTFRVYAPKAQDVELRGDYMRLETASSCKLTKGDNGVWSVTVGPIEPGTYRYAFFIDGVQTIDPKNRNAFERLDSVWSLITVRGAEYQDEQLDVPHGIVETVWYKSATLGKLRRMHVYTPPGYASGQQRYPVLYLMHSGGESDDGWPTEGRANVIFDNMIAANRVKPMIVVMPAGEVNGFFTRTSLVPDVEAFNQDFIKDIVPYVEKNYRVIADRPHRALAGESMGGTEMLEVSLLHPDQFAYVGLFSTGWFEHGDEPFVKEHEDALNNPSAKKNLLWVAVGKQDGVAGTITPQMLKILREHGFTPDYHETQGAHNWITWRDYLVIFAPKLFQ
jgi:enterochelin esterase-like enzyme